MHHFFFCSDVKTIQHYFGLYLGVTGIIIKDIRKDTGTSEEKQYV